MSGWHPIETAPKDGTKIDVWVASFTVGVAGKISVAPVGRIPDAYWGQENYIYTNPYERKIGDDGWVYDRAVTETPLIEDGDNRVTHWMPLPEPPK